MLAGDPEASLARLIAEADARPPASTRLQGDAALRRAKAKLHLLCALCDLGGVLGLGPGDRAPWTPASADASVRAALALLRALAAAAETRDAGRAAGPRQPAAGLLRARHAAR